jgi:hypothetical protein
MKNSLITGMLLASSLTIAQVNNVSAEELGALLAENKHVVPYLPADVKVAAGTSFRCDENGGATKDTSIRGRCMNYSSAATRTEWRVRFIYEGQADRVFKYEKRDSREVLTPWVTFDPDDNDVYGPPLFVSSGAKQQYVRNRDSTGRGSASTPAPANSSGSAQGSQSQSVTVMDCSGLSPYKKIACEASNASAQEALKDVPMPPAVTAPDCSGLSPFKRIACEAANAAAIEAIRGSGK